MAATKYAPGSTAYYEDKRRREQLDKAAKLNKNLQERKKAKKKGGSKESANDLVKKARWVIWAAGLLVSPPFWLGILLIFTVVIVIGIASEIPGAGFILGL